MREADGGSRVGANNPRPWRNLFIVEGKMRSWYVIALIALIVVHLMVPAFAVDDETVLEPEEPPEAAEDISDERQAPATSSDIVLLAGEGENNWLYGELEQLRANTDYIFLGVIAMSGVILGCCVGITLIRLWGA